MTTEVTNKIAFARRCVTLVFFATMAIGTPCVFAATTLDDPLIDARWLVEHATDPQVQVFDLREPAQYAQGHIPGAVNFPARLLFDAPPRHDMVAPLIVIQRVFREHGVDHRRMAVLYDDGSLIAAAPGFWVYELFGHDHVAVLDGGLLAWEKNGYKVTQDVVVPQPSDFAPTVRPARLATKFSTRLAIDNPRVAIIDARSNDNYRRSAIDGKSLFIPSAVHVPSDDLFQTTDRVSYLKSKGALAALFSDFDASNKIITYCTSGNKSAITYFSLRRLGYDVANYDGSWREWSADPSLPVASREQVVTPP